MVTPYISFLDLNEKELPKAKYPIGIFVIPIEGLALGGVSSDSKSVGYIVLVHIGTEMETNNFIKICNTVFSKYIDSKKNTHEVVPSPSKELAAA